MVTPFSQSLHPIKSPWPLLSYLPQCVLQTMCGGLNGNCPNGFKHWFSVFSWWYLGRLMGLLGDGVLLEEVSVCLSVHLSVIYHLSLYFLSTV